MQQLKHKNSQSLNGINKMIENINNLDSIFNTMKENTENFIKEARENYVSTLDNFEVQLNKTPNFTFEIKY